MVGVSDIVWRSAHCCMLLLCDGCGVETKDMVCFESFLNWIETLNSSPILKLHFSEIAILPISYTQNKSSLAKSRSAPAIWSFPLHGKEFLMSLVVFDIGDHMPRDLRKRATYFTLDICVLN